MADLAASEWLRLLAERVPSLRAAGVESFEIAGCKVMIRPSIEVFAEPAKARRDDDAVLDALDDPATYGGEVPGFVRPKDEADE